MESIKVKTRNRNRVLKDSKDTCDERVIVDAQVDDSGTNLSELQIASPTTTIVCDSTAHFNNRGGKSSNGERSEPKTVRVDSSGEIFDGKKVFTEEKIK